MEKKALGKGLSALFRSSPLDEPAEGQASILEVPVAQIEPNPYQPRREMDPERLRELTDSVREHGILQPLALRRHEGGYQLIAGERRFRAAQAAGLEQVPAVVRECTNRDMLELALIENLQREDVNAIDAAVAYRRLMEEFGLTQDEVAVRVGKSRPAVANTLRLLNLPQDIQRRVAAGALSEGHARALLALDAAPEQQHALMGRILDGHLSVREAERLVREALSRAQPEPEADPVPQRDPHLARIEERLQRHFGTRVTVRHTGATKGAIRIEFYDEEQFEHILELIGPK